MPYIDINGAWISKDKLVYIITQLEDKFVWRVVHTNGVTETGIGWFVKPKGSLKVVAQWNCNHGVPDADIQTCKGRVVMTGGKATKVIWKDKDDFETRVV